MAGIKKIVRPINKVKNLFVEYLKRNKVECLDLYYGNDIEWDYYCQVSGFVDDDFYLCYFTMFSGQVEISYSDGENSYDKLSIEEFKALID